MRAYIPDYHMITPRSLEDALSLLSNEPGKWKPFAGGTDLMVLLDAGKLDHRHYINIWPLDQLRGIVGDDNFFALLRDWTKRHRHSTAVTDDFTGLAANYADVSLRPLWDAWLYSTPVPALEGPS